MSDSLLARKADDGDVSVAIRPPIHPLWAFLDSNQRPLPYQGSALTS